MRIESRQVRCEREFNVIVCDMKRVVCYIAHVVAQKNLFGPEDWYVGYENVDYHILECCRDDFNKRYPDKNMSGDRVALDRLSTECERARRSLFSESETVLAITSL